MSPYCDDCLFYACIVFRYLLVGKIAIMANADYVVDLKTDFKYSFLCFIPHEVAGYFFVFSVIQCVS